MRTLHPAYRVTDPGASVVFYTALGYGEVGRVDLGDGASLTMLKFPSDEFVALELVHRPADGPVEIGTGLSHLAVKVENLKATVEALTQAGLRPGPIELPGGPDGPRTSWLTDPDGYRIELVQWPPGHPDGITAADFPQPAGHQNSRVALKRMDNTGIVVESLDAAISFFTELGLELEGRTMIEGEWSGRVTGLRAQRVEIAMMRTPDGHSRIELSRYLTPPAVADHRNAPVNALGYLRVMFAVDDLDDTLGRLHEHGAELVGEVVQYEDAYRLCYIRGPEGILIGLAEPLG